ncbi:type II secretion system F family protein [Streptomyces sp. NPDC004609]|uniref:type II secretion system F family protein n=1 Tax=Streptomyces sp. NPDC004609 TaxID=3364704 RepID=UPI00368FD838
MTGDAVHRPAVVVCLLALMACLAFTVAARRLGRHTRGRVEALLADGRPPRGHRPRGRRPRYGMWIRRWAPPASAVIIGYVLVGGVLGLAAGAAGAYAVHRRRSARGPAPVSEDPDGRLPLAADLLAACVSAGAGPREAAEAVGESLGGPLGERLLTTAAELRLGGEPARAWGGFARIPGALELARCLERADTTGAPAAEPVSRLARRLRAARSRAATVRARRAQVLITAPVGLCFLPAFLAVGVAPVVIGLAGGLLNAG